jgi:hypothetical protein
VDGRMVCWGGPSDDQPDTLGNVVSISCGAELIAAVLQDGRTVCWSDRAWSHQVAGAVAISCGNRHAAVETTQERWFVLVIMARASAMCRLA